MARLIDANALMHKARWMEEPDNDGIPVDIKAVPLLCVEDAPTVDAVEVVHGYWVATPVRKLNSKGKVVNYCDYYHCSECGTDRPIVPPYNYCPNCGAKMDGGKGNG